MMIITMTYEGKIEFLEPNQIFVFGSNTQGRHGAGAALIAKQKFGAIYGKAEGLQGQSYAIITKDLTSSVHPSRTPNQIKQKDKRNEVRSNHKQSSLQQRVRSEDTRKCVRLK